jgi:hypothetical protein
MTQEEKDLLLKDLCARLSYGVKCQYSYIQYICIESLIHITKNGICNLNGHIKDICDIKPYLFPLSSMTQEQESYLDLYTNFKIDMFGNLSVKDSDYNNGYANISLYDCTTIINWLLENHFDIYGLIPKGLAIDATGLNIY